MRIKHNMVVCIEISLIFLIMFAGTAAATTAAGIMGPCKVTLTQDDDTNTVGTQHTVRAKVELTDSNGNPTGLPTLSTSVDFVIAGPNFLKSRTIYTNLNDGVATFTYMGEYEGTDRITASVDTPTNVEE
ncbi:hypothetical protein V7O66_03655 [Methanolobus sp. ZRKC3]|uniref:hypothetical protein n=1 Tax=Methanolobus sp. ZRKC3 TaxID=3125786 RepID=UPI0032519B69